MGLLLTFNVPCIVNEFQSMTNKMQRYKVFISVNCSTCIGWIPHPSSGAQHCIYSIWYLWNRYCYLPLSWRVRTAVPHVEQFTEITNCITLHLVGHTLECVFVFVCLFVRGINVFRPINSVNVRYFCKLCDLEKNVVIRGMLRKKKIPVLRVPCERTIHRTVKKILRKEVQCWTKRKQEIWRYWCSNGNKA